MQEDDTGAYRMNVFLFFFLGVACLIIMTAIHELGHYLVAKGKKMNPRFVYRIFPMELGVEFEDTNVKDTIDVYLVGIIFGIIVIGMFAVINPFYLIMLVPYSFGIQSDVKELWALRKSIKLEI